MSKNELVELNQILERYHLSYWKESGLEELIKKAQKEIAYWEDSNIKDFKNALTRVIELAETLIGTKAKV